MSSLVLRRNMAFAALALFILWPDVAQAAWGASVPLKVDGSTIRFNGYGTTKEEAVLNARRRCLSLQVLQAQGQCSPDPQGIVSYSEISVLPKVGGSFLKSCDGCEIIGTKLKCRKCPPKEGVQLDVASCTPEGMMSIENCHGDLYCGMCPVLKGSGKLYPNKPFTCQRKDCIEQ